MMRFWKPYRHLVTAAGTFWSGSKSPLRLTRRQLILCLLLGLLLGIAACEPLAPEANNQVVIVITNTPTPENTPVPTSVLATPLPTRVPPSPTPTLFIPPTATIPPCTETEGRLIDSAFSSAITDDLVDYRLYVPPCFFTSGRRYPYVILLHGSGYDLNQWTDDIGIQTIMNSALSQPETPVAPMVLVMVDGGDPQELNVFDEGVSFEDIILSEVIPDVEQNFCVWNAPQGRAIGGISRGGFWALSIALRNPALFTSVGGHSPALIEDNAPPTHNPLNLAVTVPFDTPLKIYLDIARNDSGEPNATRFSNLLQNGNVPHTYEISATGGHDNEYWTAQALDYLEFYSAAWPKNVADLPTCF